MSTPDYLEFPSGLTKLDDAGAARPVMKISSMIPQSQGKFRQKVTIFLPCPAGIGFSDAATYNDADMGFFGNAQLQDKRAALATANEPVTGTGASSLARRAAGIGGGLGIKSMFQSIAAEATGGDGMNSLAAATGGFSNALAIARGVTLNKNVTTEFTGVGTRQFQFQFKFVPTSISEAVTIDKIVRYLRRGVYPEPTVGGISLKYPPKWQIEFLGGVNGEHLNAIPRVFPSYLESIGTTYNGSNAWFQAPPGLTKASAPIETDIQISFKEERALTLEDVIALESGSSLDQEDSTENPDRTPDAVFEARRTERLGPLPDGEFEFINGEGVVIPNE